MAVIDAIIIDDPDTSAVSALLKVTLNELAHPDPGARVELHSIDLSPQNLRAQLDSRDIELEALRVTMEKCESEIRQYLSWFNAHFPMQVFERVL